nr:hypothetical protein [Tanacetum cinerariifolium]
MGVFPECDAQGLLVVEPIKLLKRKKVKQQNHMGLFELIQWMNESEDDATWEDLAYLVKRFLTFILDKDNDLLKEGALVYAEISKNKTHVQGT